MLDYAFPMIEQYRRWFEYERDSHSKMLASLMAVPVEKRSTEAFQRAVDIAAHLIAARRMWLFRFGVIQEKQNLFPARAAFEDLPGQFAAMEELWDGYLAGLDDAALDRTIEYQATEGPKFRSRIGDVLTQLFGHSWYHRGQIAMLVRSLDCEPAITDFIFWTREPIG
jgi:uncharacterized damage-inducible protein DinB